MPFPPRIVSRLPFFALGALLLPALASAQITPYEFVLDTAGVACDATNATTSCVRYNGDSAFYDPTTFPVVANFSGQVGDNVPVTINNFFLPDVEQAFDTILIDAPPSVTGMWNLTTGVVTIDGGPVSFPNVVQGGSMVDPFDVDSVPQTGTLNCGSEFIPAMTGLPLPGPQNMPGSMTLVGRTCVTGPSVNETFFAVLRGELMLPEPDSSLLASAVLLALAGIAKSRGRARGRPSWAA